MQTDIASSQDGSTQTVAHEQSNSSVQTDSPKFQNSAIQTLFDTVSIHSQTDVVLHEVGVQAKDADFYELGLAESEDTFETAHEEGYLQTRSVQTSKMHLVNRVVQTHLTSTFKHKHDFEGVTEVCFYYSFYLILYSRLSNDICPIIIVLNYIKFRLKNRKSRQREEMTSRENNLRKLPKQSIKWKS